MKVQEPWLSLLEVQELSEIDFFTLCNMAKPAWRFEKIEEAACQK